MKRYCWTSLHMLLTVIISRTWSAYGLQVKPTYRPTRSFRNDNFDEILKLFNNQFVHTYHYNYFESITKGPPRVTKYCLQNRKNFKVDVDHGVSHVYCVRNARDLRAVVQINLSNEGLDISRQQAAFDAGNAVFQKYKFVWICTKHCNDGMKPNLPVGVYSAPRTKTTFSVGCQDVFEACYPSCSDKVYYARNGLVNCSRDTLVGSTCQLECDKGYVAVGTGKTQCNSDRMWENYRRFKCLPTDVGLVVNDLMKRQSLSLAGAMKELRNKIEQYLGEKSHILPSTRQESTESESATAENELIESVRTFLASLKTVKPTTEALKNLETSTCKVDADKRKDCGEPGISPTVCKARGCCWDASVRDTIWCFFKDNTVEPIKTVPQVTKKNMKKPPRNQYTNVKPTNNEVEPMDQHFPPVQLVMPQSDRQTLHDVPFPFSNDGVAPREKKGEDKRCGCLANQVTRCLAMQYVQPLPRVFCGKSINVNRSPWHVIVQYGSKMCGGTLISRDYVLTAAHCLVSRIGEVVDHSKDMVYLGVTSRNDDEKMMQTSKMGRIMRHPRFKLPTNSNVRYDIAVIKLVTRVEYTSSVRPLCLPGKYQTPYGTKCQITGFGVKIPTSGQSSNTLQMVSLFIKKPTQCNMYQSFDKKQHICAGAGPLAPADACRGDSGGPLACQGNDQGSCSWYLAGITSFGKEPCGGGSPGVYVDVSYFYDWIKSITGL